jgi:hypothetical protein
MDFLLILVAIGGFVTAMVMLVLASRATRMQSESDARVETLQAMATGSVLFASSEPVAAAPADEDLDLELYGLVDEDEHHPDGRRAEARPQKAVEVATPAPAVAATPLPPRYQEPAHFARPAAAFPFVMTVPAAAGTSRVQVSFDRTRNRSGS